MLVLMLLVILRVFTPFVNDLTINLVIMTLIVVGGIGFLVVREVVEYVLDRQRGYYTKN